MAPPLRGIIITITTTSTLVPRGGLKSDFPAIGPIVSGVKKRRPTNKVLWEKKEKLLLQKKKVAAAKKRKGAAAKKRKEEAEKKKKDERL